MKEGFHYTPCFAVFPDTWDARWAALREFTRRWHGVSLGPVGAPSTLAGREELKLGFPLPTSFREWVGFADELLAQDAFGILRDTYEVTHLQDQAATTLMLQCEGDVYWAVKDQDLGTDDPAVGCYLLDENTKTFAFYGPESPHITSFTLGHMTHFLNGPGGGCLVDIDPTKAFLEEMTRSFQASAQFGSLRVFESENIIAIILPDLFEEGLHRLCVEVSKPMPMKMIPSCVLDHTKNGGSFHGMFVPKRWRGRF